MAIFAYIGYFSYEMNIDITSLQISGPELSFIVYPAALNLMPLKNLWSALFFLVMITLGIDTQVFRFG